MRIVHDAAFLAKTLLSWPPEDAVFMVSPDYLQPGVVAHELVHCLVPTRKLFIAEGLATWVGAQITGDCSALWFEEPTLATLLARNWRGTPALSSILEEEVDHAACLSPEQFSLIDGRLAHALAGSFCGFYLRRYPRFAVESALSRQEGVRSLLERISGRPLEWLESCWRREVLEKQP